MDYTPHTDQQVNEMLQAIGATSVDDLFEPIPEAMRSAPFNLPKGLSEAELLNVAGALASQNTSTAQALSFLGAGAYDHLIPTVVDTISSRGEWLTPYTPYQAEASQGTLQMIYEFQTMICDLMQMDVANASLYDGASALAEAAVLALRSGERTRLLVSDAIHPHARQVLATYLSGFPCTIQTIPVRDGATDVDALKAALKDDVAAVLMQQPNVFGCLEPMEQAGGLAHQVGALFIASVYPVSLGLLKPPGAYGADIAVAEGRCFGSPVSAGGPGLGLFTVTNALLRRMPGRIAGCTVDHANRRGFTLTLQTREQHIRREKATSNICTNEGWLCLRATIFMSLLGPTGLRDLAWLNLQKAHEFAARLEEAGLMEPIFTQPFFNELALRPTGGQSAEAMQKALLKANILGGLPLGAWYPSHADASLWCVTEKISAEQMDRVLDVLSEIPGGGR